MHATMREPSLWDATIRWLAARGHAVPRDLLERDFGIRLAEVGTLRIPTVPEWE